MQSYGYLISDNIFVFSIDELSSSPILDEYKPIDVLSEHLDNLISTANPYYFDNENTFGDIDLPSNLKESTYPTVISSGKILTRFTLLGLIMFSGFRESKEFSDLFVGWLSKAICDYLNISVKVTQSAHRSLQQEKTVFG